MPWPHCDQQVSDDLACPVCGLTKKEWTLKVEVTRVFKIGGRPALKVELRDEEGGYVAGEQVRIVLPDGQVLHESLSVAGYHKATSKLPGAAVVSFPALGEEVTCVEGDAAPGEGGTFLCPTGPAKFVFRRAPRSTWVELDLRDALGRGLGGERVLVRHRESGVTREAVLDPAGFVRVEGLRGSEVEVCFLDREVGTGAPLALPLDLELRDPAGEPVPGARYEVRVPAGPGSEGQVITGTLDDRGRATLEGLFAEGVEVRFPDHELNDAPRRVEREVPDGWLELVLEDDEGQAVPHELYELRLPGGRLYSGFLDEHGKARLGGLEGVRCEVRFPRREGQGLVPAGTRGVDLGRPAAGLLIELRDRAGRPAAGEPFLVRCGERVISGELDERGQARLAELDAGVAEVCFPGRDPTACRLRTDWDLTPPPKPPRPLEGAGKQAPDPGPPLESPGVSLPLEGARKEAPDPGPPLESPGVSLPERGRKGTPPPGSKPDRPAPQVTIKAPAAGAVVRGASTILWATRGGPAERVVIELSGDGVSWSPLVMLEQDFGRYAWDGAGVAPGRYRIRITAGLGSARSEPAVSDEFTVAR